MDGMRISPPGSIALWVPCCRCGSVAQGWDRIAEKPYCPNCEEAIIIGEAPPLIERTDKGRCTICACLGTVRYLTFPHNSLYAVDMDLCPEHLRCLLGRRLGTHAFAQLRRQLEKLGINVGDVFLLHEAFYDMNGRALQPASDPF
ncbi:MAG TPA: hypothetical protein VEL76_38630 [Gemmataceae bacterium]|nr:hypothetical protein [Gemmataceae bacterium]